MKFIFSDIGNVIIPTDELIFFRGVETTKARPVWRFQWFKVQKSSNQ
jgi:hypothetical protein